MGIRPLLRRPHGSRAAEVARAESEVARHIAPARLALPPTGHSRAAAPVKVHVIVGSSSRGHRCTFHGAAELATPGGRISQTERCAAPARGGEAPYRRLAPGRMAPLHGRGREPGPAALAASGRSSSCAKRFRSASATIIPLCELVCLHANFDLLAASGAPRLVTMRTCSSLLTCALERSRSRR